MNGSWDAFLNVLICSSLLLLFSLLVIHIFRCYLIRKQYARSLVLKVWLMLPVVLVSSCIFSNNAMLVVDMTSVVVAAKAPIERLESLTSSFDWQKALVLTWFTFAMWRLLRLKRQYFKIKSRINTEYKPFSESVYFSPSGWPPMAFGFIRPKVFLPGFVFKELSGDDMKLLVMHEKIHCQRADPFWRLCFEALSCVFWFLPLRRFGLQVLVDDQEMSCDELVVASTQDATAYAHLLLNLGVRCPQDNGSSMMCTYTIKLKERIMNLSQIKQQRNKGFLVGILCLSAVALGAVAGLPAPSDESGVQLEVIERVAPRYPFGAYKKKLEGAVELAFKVTKAGQVKDVKVASSEPAGVFDKVAIAAIQQWTFAPLTQETQASQVLEFKMD